MHIHPIDCQTLIYRPCLLSFLLFFLPLYYPQPFPSTTLSPSPLLPSACYHSHLLKFSDFFIHSLIAEQYHLLIEYPWHLLIDHDIAYSTTTISYQNQTFLSVCRQEGSFWMWLSLHKMLLYVITYCSHYIWLLSMLLLLLILLSLCIDMVWLNAATKFILKLWNLHSFGASAGDVARAERQVWHTCIE